MSPKIGGQIQQNCRNKLDSVSKSNIFHYRKSEWKNKMTDKTRSILKKWLWADYMLYDHFKKLLDERIENYNSISEEYSQGWCLKINTSELHTFLS